MGDNPRKQTDFVFVPVHSSECTNMGEDVLQSISQLESIDVSEPELDVCVDDKFR